MKSACFGLLVCLMLVLPALADDKLRLSQEDAKQLHAFLLTGELLDFGERAKSASAYLMAAELLLDYPNGMVAKSRIFSLCEQARPLASGDDFLETWIDRIENRARKTSRGSVNNFLDFVIELTPGESLVFPGEFDAGWLTCPGAELQIVGPDSIPLKTGKILSTEGLDNDEDLSWRLQNLSSEQLECRLLLRKKTLE